MGMDAVQIHIADKYYITDAWWSDPKFINDLKERVDKQRPLLIGKPAIDIELMHVPSEHFIKAENDSALKRFPHVGRPMNLYGLESDFIVLMFWEAGCGHCKTIVPKMYEIFQKELKDKNIEVLAVSTLFGEEGKIEWIDFVNKYKLYDWINSWNPYSYDFKVKYDVVVTPQIFILDKNKTIVAKKISPEQVVEIVDVLIKQRNNKNISKQIYPVK
jgi:thiol-disulfide isomerase/thioredoxin